MYTGLGGRKVMVGLLLLCMLSMVIGTVGCSKRSKAAVQLTYTEQPRHDLPDSLSSIAFIPFDQAVEDAEKLYNVRERKWQDHVIAALAAGIEQSARQNNRHIDIVDRESVAAIMKEKDLADAGLAEPNKALELGKLAQAQAICYGRVAIDIDTVRGKEKTISFRKSGDRVVPVTEYKDRIKRTIQVAMSVKIVAVANGKSIVTFADTASHTVDHKPGAFFGSDAQEADLEPEDEAIANLINSLVERFLGTIMPRQVTFRVRLAEVEYEAAEAVPRLIEMGETGQAIALLKEALAEYPDDDGAWFNLGVAYELQSDLKEAAAAYKQAYALEDDDDYLASYRRVQYGMGNGDAALPRTGRLGQDDDDDEGDDD